MKTLDIPAILAYPSVADISKAVTLSYYGFIDTAYFGKSVFFYRQGYPQNI